MVCFYVMRHGKWAPREEGEEDGPLTEEGIQQVVRSAQEHLWDVKIHMALHSGKERAEQTARITLANIKRRSGLKSIVEKDEGFSYELGDYLGDYENQWLYEDASAKVKEAKASGKAETVDLWLKNWPKALIFRGRVQQALVMWAWIIAGDSKYTDYNVFVGSHSPVAEAAALDPKSTPRLREADIIRYEVEVSDTGTIISSDVLRAPY